MKKKLGFTLIEMLVVIAIIAVLVSVMIPVVQGSTTRAGAAANAANLRAMEAKLNIMRMENSEAFETALDNPFMETDLANFVKFLFDVMNGQGSADLALSRRFTYFTADANGKIELWTGTTVEAVPVSAEVQVPGLKKPTSITVEKGDPMTVVITDQYVRAYYGNPTTGYYSVDNFADVAEDGKFDGRVALGDSEGGDNWGGWGAGLCDLRGYHDWNEENVCKSCGLKNDWHVDCVDADKNHKCDKCFEVLSECGTDENKDHRCDYCSNKVSECKIDGYDDEGHFCTYCGARKGAHSESWRGDNCTQSGCPYHKGKKECGCNSASWFGCITCWHSHKQGEACTELVDSGTWVK